MSGGGAGQGAVYSPLPQNISDTDSSEEELNNVIHHNDNKKFIVTSKDSIDKLNGKKMGEYRQLGHDGEGEVSVNGLANRDHATADDIPIIKPDGVLPRHMEPMSPLRKVCFVLSILLCGLTIIVFLWVLPCDWATCPAAPVRSGSKSWDITLQGLELKGGIGVVAGVPGRGRNLVFLARGDIINEALEKSTSEGHNKKAVNSRGGRLVSLIGSTGEVAWYIEFTRMPHDMDCTLIDVTSDGAEDCIILGSGKLLAAVNPIPGNLVWYVHSHNDSLGMAVDMEFPIIIPDLDGDGVNDLVTACSFNRTAKSSPTVTLHNNLILISGKMGKIIGQAYTDKECTYISELEAKDTWTIKYSCQKYKKGSTKELPVKTLYLQATNTQLNASIYRQNPSLKQHQTFRTGSQIDEEINNHNLTLINQGHCPNQCSVSVQITVKRGNNYNVVSNFIQENTHGMVPAVLVFDNHTGSTNEDASFEPIRGFVVKFWTWMTGNGHHSSSNQKNDDNKSQTSSNPLFRNRLRRSSFFSDLYERKLSHRVRRSVKPTLQQNPRNESIPRIEVHQLKERVVIFTFNATDSHIVNASLHDITQLCIPVLNECQPDQSFQDQSLLIADLDQDGTQELISYLTTYTRTDPDGSTSDSPKWHLQSRVRVDRLEAEHPKLYEAVARQ